MELNPNLTEAKLFGAECYAARKELDKAKNEIAEAKKIAENNQVDQQWLDLLPIIESSLNQPA